ncbi:MAG: CoA transferase [Pseudomonadota bacterium]
MSAFAGLRVVDFTHVLAGPACAYFMGCLGADVIKVESVRRGDAMRWRGGTDKEAQTRGLSTAYATQGGGKRSIAVDLGHEEGRRIFLDLIAKADVLIENHLPDTMDALDLSPETLRRVNPRLIHCGMTGYGRDGPRENHPAYDVNIQAASGLMAMTGTVESGPTRTGAPIMDYGTALAGAFAVSSALYAREQTGQGAFIDLSMMDVAMTLMSSTVTDYRLTGQVPVPRGNGANSRSVSAGSFPCRRGLLSLGVNEEHQFRALARALGQTEWLSNPAFVDARARSENRDAFLARLEAILAERDAEDWEARLLAEGVPAAAVRSLEGALADDHVKVRATAGAGAALPLPFRMNGEVLAADGEAGPSGQETAEVLGEIGRSADEVTALVEAGVVRLA